MSQIIIQIDPDGRPVPYFFCDRCGQPIQSLKDALLAWNVGTQWNRTQIMCKYPECESNAHRPPFTMELEYAVEQLVAEASKQTPYRPQVADTGIL